MSRLSGDPLCHLREIGPHAPFEKKAMAVVFGQDLTKINAPAFARALLSKRLQKQGVPESDSLFQGAVPMNFAEKVIAETFLESVTDGAGKSVLDKLAKRAEGMATVFFGEFINLRTVEQAWIESVMAICPTKEEWIHKAKIDEETAALLARIGVPFTRFAAKIIYLARHAICRKEAALLLTLRQGKIYEVPKLLSALEDRADDWVVTYEAMFRGWEACSRPILNGSATQIRKLVTKITGTEYPTDQIGEAAELLGLKFHSHK
jgi:hypothetical protein